jgi:hypothetical protein
VLLLLVDARVPYVRDVLCIGPSYELVPRMKNFLSWGCVFRLKHRRFEITRTMLKRRGLLKTRS